MATVMWWLCAAALADPGWVGTWQNESGSALRIRSVAADGTLVGQYSTELGAPDATQWFDVRGSANGDQLAFVVSWGEHASLTAWVGQRIGSGGEERLRTLWHLTRDVPEADEADAIWS